jgi:hypothetical protein
VPPISLSLSLSLSLSGLLKYPMRQKWIRNNNILEEEEEEERETKPDPKCGRRSRRGLDTAAATCNRHACIADGYSHLKKTQTPAEDHALGANG